MMAYPGFFAAVAAGLVLPHGGVLRHYHARLKKKTNQRKKTKRKGAQESRRRNRRK